MNDGDLFAQATNVGQWFFLAADQVDTLRERILAPGDRLGPTRNADVRLLVEIARRNLRGEAPANKDLVGTFGWSAKTLTNDLDRLQQGGYISRERTAPDRRRVACHITDEGQALLVAIFDPAREELQTLRPRGTSS